MHREFIIETDACKKPEGCALQQEQDYGTLQLVDYWSKTLNDAEKTFDSTQKECLAVARAVFLLRLYV